MPVFKGHPNNAKSKIQNAKTTVKQKLNSKLQEEFMLPMLQSQIRIGLPNLQEVPAKEDPISGW
jgi:hypothetical protein